MIYDYTMRICTHKKLPNHIPLNDTPSYYDLTFVFSGTMTYIINGEEVVLETGDAIFIRPGEHRQRLPVNNRIHYFSINFYKNTPDEINIPRFIQNGVSSTLKDLLLVFERINSDHSSLNLEEKQNLGLKLILRTLTDIIKQNAQSPYLTEILRYIKDNYSKKITLQDIADSVSLTVPYCCYLVKKELNVTIYDLILRERIMLAQDYILEGMHSLQEICKLCGFNDYNHFSKYFKKSTGFLPSQYKKLK